uniref:LRRNT domain-containing protein n=1 Tax=Hippocampus comes TaxID=109280 RepID=A0A3Q2ZBM1_HIPCM
PDESCLRIYIRQLNMCCLNNSSPICLIQFTKIVMSCSQHIEESQSSATWKEGTLTLNRNNIRSLPESAFVELAHLRDLYLAHNRIDSLSSGALRRLGPELRLLDLSHNQLRQASRDEFGGTRAKTRLYHNPWHCDCTLQELMEALNLEAETVNGIVCESSEPGVMGEHAGQPLDRILDSGVNFCSLQRKTTDVAMLVTMFVWFFMVIVYVVYYVRQNQAEARRHLEYLKSLPSPRKTPTETDTLSTVVY